MMDIFTLYGGTAIALQLGHRVSVDFDFFSSSSFTADKLFSSIPFLYNSQILRSEENTLTCRVDKDGPVNVSFFGNLSLKKIDKPFLCADNSVKVASLKDLIATKVKVIQDRASYKDYFDIYTILTQSEITLADSLRYATIVYGNRFSPAISLKALVYFGDKELSRLSEKEKNYLRKVVSDYEHTRNKQRGNQLS